MQTISLPWSRILITQASYVRKSTERNIILPSRFHKRALENPSIRSPYFKHKVVSPAQLNSEIIVTRTNLPHNLFQMSAEPSAPSYVISTTSGLSKIKESKSLLLISFAKWRVSRPLYKIDPQHKGFSSRPSSLLKNGTLNLTWSFFNMITLAFAWGQSPQISKPRPQTV
jgi:hypothetical protein